MMRLDSWPQAVHIFDPHTFEGLKESCTCSYDARSNVGIVWINVSTNCHPKYANMACTWPHTHITHEIPKDLVLQQNHNDNHEGLSMASDKRNNSIHL